MYTNYNIVFSEEWTTADSGQALGHKYLCFSGNCA